MNQFTTEIVDALVKKQDITEVFRSRLEMAIIVCAPGAEYPL